MRDLTAPFDGQALSQIAHDIETTARVYATDAAGVELGDLDVVSLSLLRDELAWPSVNLDVTAAIPDFLQRLDPRQGVRLRCELGYRYPGNTLDQHPVADLTLSRWNVALPGETVNLSAYSDELVLMEWAELRGGPTYAIGTPLVNVIKSEITRLLGRSAVLESTSAATLAEPLTITPKTNVWDVLRGLAEQAGLWFRCDALRNWRISERPTSVGASVVQVTTGELGIATEMETVMSREKWGNAVLLTYASGETAYAEEPGGPLGTETVGVCAITEDLRAPWPGTVAATAAARNILSRAITRGDFRSLTALAAFWLKPGHTITDPDLNRTIASQVLFTFPDSLMQVKTRKA